MKGTSAQDPDLTFVAPERRKLVAARIAVLERYLALEAPTIADADAFAAELNMATSSFYALARVWKRSRDPRMLRGAGTRRTRKKRELGDEEFLRERLGVADQAATIEQQTLEIEAAARAFGVKVRSRSALRRFVEAYRREEGLLAPTVLEDLAVDYSAIDIPVLKTGSESAVLPVAAVLIHIETATVIAAELALDPPSPATAASLLAKAIEEKHINDFDQDAEMVGSLKMTIDKREGWSTLTQILASHGVVRLGKATPVRITTGLVPQLLGRRIGGFETHDRLAFRQSDDRASRVARGSAPILLSDAQAALDQRLALLTRPRLCLPPRANARQLAEALREQARGLAQG